MKDSSKQFYHFNKSEFRFKLISEAIRKYKYIQSFSPKHVNAFLDLGVPDWRLEKLPGLYNSLIAENDLLIKDELTTKDIKKLFSLSDQCFEVCEKLAESGIPETYK